MSKNDKLWIKEFTLVKFTSLSSVILSAVVYGSGHGILQRSIQAWMMNKVSIEERCLANGMFFNSLVLGVVCGSIFLGLIASSFGSMPMYQLSVLFMLLFLLILVVSQVVERRNHVMEEVKMRKG
ncbi:MFS transporter [Alkalihalobacillus sp. LMS39]|uniref:MFS transporter n=1 Tax=Alkalihalobacillus sp. LMS39 TaxID=2924032 RepID=UPI001FB2D4F5|nr:MFS transporter [Alkalihalobacillus sp. LMS39]UOE92701.1 hypothetical protein MM271_15845 [Alkalihalobacillus sp. LMS39]